MITLNRAIVIATEAHAGQTDKGGQPYILHLLRVMLAMPDDDHRIVAVMHDVIEDTTWNLGMLEMAGFTDEQIAAIDALSRISGEAYETFIGRVAANPMATRVKLADLADNANILRLPRPITDADWKRQGEYAKAIDALWLAASDHGLKL